MHDLCEVEPVVLYNTFGVTDWMINFQGGFVRRGLLGEGLYQLCAVGGFWPVHHVVMGLEVTALVVLVGVFLWICWRRRWLPLMPLMLMVGGLLTYRRDFLMLLLAWAVLEEMFRYRRDRRQGALWVAICLMTFSILIYEPFFFFCVPLSMLLYAQTLHAEKVGFWQQCGKTLMVFALPLATMFIVCLYKGDPQTADAVWLSWKPMLDALGVPLDTTGIGVKFMGLSTGEAMAIHLKANFGIDATTGTGANPLLVCGVVVMLLGLYFLTTQMPLVGKKRWRDCVLASDIFLFQTFCMLPLFTVLSCDYVRTVNYVIYTTLMVVYMAGKYKQKVLVPWSVCSGRVQAFVLRNAVLSSFWFYLVVLLFIPFHDGEVSILHPLWMEYVSRLPLHYICP